MEIDYQIKNSTKSRYMRIAVYPDGQVVVTKPASSSAARAIEFVNRKSGWIQKKLDFYKNRKVISLGNLETPDKKEVLAFVKGRIEIYNQHYHFNIGKVSIKNHKSLWGSCSSRKNLNFNIKIAQLTQEQSDYIIVHELCHLREFNHSKKFWELVAETIPNFRSIKQELKSYSFY